MIDLHSHFLPALDDGANSMEESLAMLRMAAAAGVTDMAATPHANFEYAFDPLVVRRTLEEVRQAAPGLPRIHFGCELHVTPENIRNALRQPEQYSLAGRGYVLLEFSDFAIPQSSGQVLGEMLRAGLVPVVAHPERNPLLRERRRDLEAWVLQGCLLQVTGQSLLGGFGRTAKSAALDLMERRLVHLIASDAHDLERRPPALDAVWRCVKESFGAQTAHWLMQDNPRCILQGLPIPDRPPAMDARRWFPFR